MLVPNEEPKKSKKPRKAAKPNKSRERSFAVPVPASSVELSLVNLDAAGIDVHSDMHMQKAMEQMNVKLMEVVTDVTRVTGMSIIEAIPEGERDPIKLAKLRDNRCFRSEKEIALALEGTWRPEHLFELRQVHDLYHFHHRQITECDQQVQAELAKFANRAGENAGSRRVQSTRPSCNLHAMRPYNAKTRRKRDSRSSPSAMINRPSVHDAAMIKVRPTRLKKSRRGRRRRWRRHRPLSWTVSGSGPTP